MIFIEHNFFFGVVMNRMELEQTTRQWISLWCAPLNYDLFNRLHADDFVDCAPAGRPPTKKAYLGDLEEFIAAFPDLTARIEDIVIEETSGKVAVRWLAEGTNRQRFLGVGPTGKRTFISGIEIIEIRKGQIIRRWGEWDITNHLSGKPA